MKKLIFLIEDDMPTVDVYKTAMEKAGGFKVEVFDLGEDIINKAKEIAEGKVRKPDLILLDLLLPDMNGTQVLKELRARNETKNIPLYILTNYGDEKTKEKNPALRNEKFIIKTKCPPSKLVDLINKELK